jgi:hypothetical protein
MTVKGRSSRLRFHKTVGPHYLLILPSLDLASHTAWTTIRLSKNRGRLRK